MHNHRAVTFVRLSIAVLVLAPAVHAQDLSLLDAEHTRLILQEVSGDAAYEHIRFMTHFHRPRGGSDNLWRVAQYYEEKAREYGLSDVRLIKQASTTLPWNAKFADLWIVEPTPERIASTLQSPLHLADYSRSADVTAELIDIGAGTPADYEGKEVEGKVVLTHGSIGAAMREAVWERGALGIVWYPDPLGTMGVASAAGFSRPDQLRWVSVPREGPEGREPTFAFGLSVRQGIELSNRLARADEPIVVHAKVDASVGSLQGTEPWQVMVEAFIRGSDPRLGQDIVLTGHLQEEGTSANDDASGTASVLEIGRALTRLISGGRLPRPRRNIRFWWVTEIGSERQYFADHPEARRQMWVNVNQDMVGANQAQDVMRKQNVTRVPATRFHFFNDVVESVVKFMVAANTAELAQAQNGIQFYPTAHLAHLGTRHRYNAEMIFFHNNTDHMTFTETPIGIPAVTFTNMPDHYIHSSDDDLWNIDRTQLGRNAASVALIAYIMATADEGSVARLAAATVGRGLQRLGRNLELGLSWIARDPEPAPAYARAHDQLWYAAERERLALRSLSEIHPGAAAMARDLVRELERREAQAVRELDIAYRHRTGGRPPQQERSDVERHLEDLRPAVIAGPTEFLTGRSRLPFVRGLHSLMAFEVLNAVNGERNGLDIYRYVAAEAREAGEHYYGTVAPAAVLEYLEGAAEAGLIRLK
ncbi:MAG: M28 family peptidase [Gemmatimonadales bacterium]